MVKKLDHTKAAAQERLYVHEGKAILALNSLQNRGYKLKGKIMNNEILETRVKGVNNAHQYGNELYHILVKVFKPFIGQKVIRKTGGLIKKIQDIIDSLDLPHSVPIQVYRKSYSDYSLSYVVKTCQTLNQTAYYYEVSVYIGNIENGILKDINYPFPDFKTDFKAKTIQENRKLYKELQEKADKAKSALFPFDTYDR